MTKVSENVCFASLILVLFSLILVKVVFPQGFNFAHVVHFSTSDWTMSS